MKRIISLVAACALVAAGCGKAKAPPPPEYNQVTVDVPKFMQAFSGTQQPEVQQSVSMVQRNLRYGDYPKALMSLDELANNPAVTAPQKKVVNELIEQVRKVINQAPAPGAGTQ